MGGGIGGQEPPYEGAAALIAAARRSPPLIPGRRLDHFPTWSLRRPWAAHPPVRPLGADLSACRSRRICHANFRSCSPLSFDRRLRPAVLDARPGRRLRRRAPGYPPYNIERTGENAYRITVAVAGFAENDLSIEVKENTLTIRGEKQAKAEKPARCSTRASRPAPSSALPARRPRRGQGREPGERLLHVDLVREIPEAKKPRQIPIGNGKPR